MEGAVTLKTAFKLYDKEGLSLVDQESISKYCYGNGMYCLRPNNLTQEYTNPRELIQNGIKLGCMMTIAQSQQDSLLPFSDFLKEHLKQCIVEAGSKCFALSDSEFIDSLNSEGRKQYSKCILAIEEIKSNPEELHAALDVVKIQNNMFGAYDAVPSMFIFGQLVRGSLTAETGISAMCDCLNEKPLLCADIETYINKLTIKGNETTAIPAEAPGGESASNGVSEYSFILSAIFVLGICLLLALLFFMARCLLRRLLLNDMKSEVEGKLYSYTKMKASEMKATDATQEDSIEN